MPWVAVSARCIYPSSVRRRSSVALHPARVLLAAPVGSDGEYRLGRLSSIERSSSSSCCDRCMHCLHAAVTWPRRATSEWLVSVSPCCRRLRTMLWKIIWPILLNVVVYRVTSRREWSVSDRKHADHLKQTTTNTFEQRLCRVDSLTAADRSRDLIRNTG